MTSSPLEASFLLTCLSFTNEMYLKECQPKQHWSPGEMWKWTLGFSNSADPQAVDDTA